MKIKINNIKEIGNKAIVEVMKDNKIRSYTFSKLDLIPHPETNRPLFLDKLKEIYTDKPIPKKTKKAVKNYINQEIELNDFESLTPYERFRKKQKQGEKYINANAEKLAKEVYISPRRKDNEVEDGISSKDKSNTTKPENN
jgi:protein tyrosine phosphatase